MLCKTISAAIPPCAKIFLAQECRWLYGLKNLTASDSPLNSSIAMVARRSKSRTGIRQESAQQRHPNPRTFEAQKAPANAKGCPPKFSLPLFSPFGVQFRLLRPNGFLLSYFLFLPPRNVHSRILCSSLPEHFPYGFVCRRKNPADLFVKTAMSCCLCVRLLKIPTPTPQKKKFRGEKREEEEANAEPIPISLTGGFPTTSYC